MGPWDRRVLRAYWARLQIVFHAGSYSESEFQGFGGVTQWDPLPPTIFNVMVDAVVHHWISLVLVGVIG